MNTDRDILIDCHTLIRNSGYADNSQILRDLRKIIRGTPADKQTMQPETDDLAHLKREFASIDHKGGKTAGHSEE